MECLRIKWDFLVLGMCLTFVRLISALGNVEQVAEEKFELHANEVADNGSGFISIDCGVTEHYSDATTGIWYQTDEDFIETGINNHISPYITFSNPYIGEQLNTLRSFPGGDKNCYTLKPNQGKGNKYLIRAFFFYGNYDNENKPPAFDLYLGVNYWDTVQLPNANYYQFYEIIHVPLTDIIHVCLLNTQQGTPFISSLELRPLNNSIYSAPLPLRLVYRVRVVSSTLLNIRHSRYKDDVYDRIWLNDYYSGFYDHLYTSANITSEAGDSAYKLPSEALSSAVQPFASNNVSRSIYLRRYLDVSSEYYVYLHFAEIQWLAPGQKRIINVVCDGIDSPSQPITLDHLKPVTLTPKKPIRGYVRCTITATNESDAPPILNAFEIYRMTPLPNSPTDATDVGAILEIKHAYGLSRINWQGDPCVPSKFAWDGLNCSSDQNPRIISLNLSSSKLTGQITSSFSHLKRLESLDMSYNELTGPLPEFLGELPYLKFLNLTGNKLTGSVPKALKEKADLQLSLADNPGLCQIYSCKEHKFVIPLIASVAVFLIIVIVSVVIWRLRKKRQVLSIESQKGSLNPKNRAFSYSEVHTITDNFKTAIGEGGFGKVYLGTLQDETQVAVKLLSPSSKQGDKEFHAEAQLLMIVHHRNLVSLVGYCNEGGIKALIYEYMDNGDLGQQLSVKNPHVLKWNKRLQIAVDAAKGLDYLHNGCKPPIIHRDLKPSNILLNKNLQAKIADFGLSRAFINERDSHLSTQPAGTPGYIDPEFQRSGSLNKKSDIYSFGMILLELITGQPPIRRAPDYNIIFILDWVGPKIDSGDIQETVDPRLQGEFSTISAWKAVEIALSCVSPTATQRPDISSILQELKECLALELDHVRTDSHWITSSSSLGFTLQLESEMNPSVR